MRSATILALAVCTGCGLETGTEDPPEPVVYGSLELTAAGGVATYDLTSVDLCERDVDSGLAKITLSAGLARLEMKIKGFASSARTYECAQAADNATELGSVGGKFDGCMVSVQAPSAPDAATADGYDMHRAEPDTKLFTYEGGTCQIDVTSGPSALAGSVTCPKLIQTSLEGAPRNPIDPSVTADLRVASFRCDMP